MLAVFGGSFDPPHRAHLEVVREVMARSLADRVLVVPCVRHAFAKQLTDFSHRLCMARTLCDLAGRGVMVSDIERRLHLSGYTIDTLRALEREHPDEELRLVVGSDVLGESHRWKGFDEVRRLASLIVVLRQGHPIQDADLGPPSDVSSTQVRRILARGEHPGDLVPEPVLRYIRDHGLYKG